MGNRGWSLALGVSFLVACTDAGVERGAPKRQPADSPFGAALREVAIAPSVTSPNWRLLPGGFESKTRSYVAQVDGTRLQVRNHEGGRALVISGSCVDWGSGCAPLASPELSDQGTLVARGTSVSERLESTPTGVHQSWHFSETPPGDGDLVVRVAIRGVPFHAETRDGLVFGPDERRRFRYGHGTWIDAEGRETRAPVRWSGGSAVLTVSRQVLRESEFPAVLDPIIGPELDADQSVLDESAAHDFPRSAFDGTNHLVAWTDERFDTAVARVYAARVSPAGVVLDRPATQVGIGSAPTVTFDGTRFVVAWTRSRNLFVRRISPSGVPIDAAPIDLGALPQFDNPLVGVIWDGTRYFVWWTGGGELHALRLDANLTPIDTITAAQFVGGRASAVRADAVWNGLHHFVAYHARTGDDDIHAVRVMSDGTVLDPGGIPVLRENPAPDLDQSSPTVSFDGTNHLVVAQHEVGPDELLIGARVALDGTVLDTTPIDFGLSNVSASRPDSLWNGSHHVATWTEGGQLKAARMSANGSVDDPGGVTLTTLASAGRAHIAWDGTAHSFFFHGRPYPEVPGTVVGLRVNGDLSVPSPTPTVIPWTAQAQTRPTALFDGTRYFTAWQQKTRDDPGDVTAARIDANGLTLDAAAIAVAAFDREQKELAAAAGDQNYLVAWRDDRTLPATGVHAARVSKSGALLDPTPIAIVTNVVASTPIAVGSDGVDFLVVYQQGNLFGVRVSAAGVVLDPTPLSIGGSGNTPDVVWNGSSYLVVWREGFSSNQLYGRRVATNGSFVDAAPVQLTSTGTRKVWPKLAWNGNEYLLVWEDDGAGSWDILGTRLAADLTVLDSPFLPISTDGGDATDASVAWDGLRYLIAWQHSTGTFDTNILLGRVAADGTPLDGNGVPISAEPNEEQIPSVAARAPGRALVVYSRFVSPGDEALRVRARLLNFELADGEVCNDGTECASGSCVGGCCTTPCAGAGGAAGGGGTAGQAAAAGAAGAGGVGAFGGVGGLGGSSGNAGSGMNGGSGAAGNAAGTAGLGGTPAAGGSPAGGMGGTLAAGGVGGTGVGGGTAGTGATPGGADAGSAGGAGARAGASGASGADGSDAQKPGGCATAPPGRTQRGSAGGWFALLLVAWRRRGRYRN